MKLLTLCFLCAIPFSTLAQVKDIKPMETQFDQSANVVPYGHDSLAIQIIEYSKSFLKTPYHYGKSSRNGFDCSGFVSTVFKKFGVSLARSSRDMVGSGRKIGLTSLKKGDLLFFINTNRNRKGVSHVAIIAEIKEKEVYIIHSVPKFGVKIDKLNNPYYTKRLFTAERLFLLDTIGRN